mmetsp:Transcript_12780/g.12682  ORF Transcript_12780/g.12682 Transcript_12780/m.12682 type:complete len:175 (+) Transcript_12780:919-1443(+)|eukprot:CAMPEP_0170551328 /NCGR_PEP_ID=MMETSP0211-20121228/9345_1 /TAXON_ID=311385 /ORGANISM="Pseudokeronopsis sp., Strain OXSARD2" /LENGTH=174 /DNA_ID=CAMNT_0010858429 /DNA_START=864 /DNA_END=1388 /DNA_ORIENTATION=+
MTSVLNVTLPSQRLIQQSSTSYFKPPPPSKPKKVEEETKGENLEEEEDEDDGEEEFRGKLVGRGIGVALKVFREKGLLHKSIFFGRNKDQTLDKQLKSFGIENQEEDRVQIGYFDKAGQKQTLKNEFRQLCWKFHGKMPSHKKQEKLRLKEEAKMKKAQTPMTEMQGTTGTKKT